MKFMPFQKKTFVGLDLGHHTLKAIQIERHQGTWKITRCGSWNTPADTIKDGVVIDPELLSLAIKDMLKASHITANAAHVAVAGGAVVVRNVRIPKLPEATLRKSIKFEATRYVPSSVEESYIEFEILGDTEDGQMDVLIVAAPRDLVESRMKACELAGLSVESVDVEPFAVYRSLVEADDLHDWSDRTVALVDLGAANANLSVIHQGQFVMTRSMPNGANTFTEALKNYFKLTNEDAEAGKEQLDLTQLLSDAPMEAPPLRVIQPHVDDLVREIRRSINYFQSQQTDGGAKTVDSLIVCGGGAKLPGLTEYIAKKLSMEAVSTGVFDNPKFSSLTAEETRGLELAVASGLAMRSFPKAA